MGFWDKILARSRAEPKDLPTGRQTMVGDGYTNSLSPHRSRTANILETLRGIPDESSAVEFLKRVNPDVSMSVWNFVRLANQGNEMQFYDARDTKSRLMYLNDEWREFASRINEISNAGLDGLIDQFHYSSFLLGAMGCEVEVTPDMKDIYDVYPVKPKTIEWELKSIKGRKKWVPYQMQMFKKVYLDPDSANFFWVPTDPEIGDPRGTLNMTPVLQAIDFQMQILQDLQAVLHHQGWPRDDYEINLERMMTYCPQHIINDSAKLDAWLKEQYNYVVNTLKTLRPDSDIVHYDDIKRNQGQGGANQGRSLDVRAVNELVDVQVLNGAKQMGIFSNRISGNTESWGTVQFRIFCSGIASCQRGSKRLIEEIARLWLRVKGVQAIPKFRHDTVDWNSEEQRMNVNILKQQFYAIAVMMKWIDNDTAAREVMKTENAIGEPPIEQIRVSFSSGGEGVDNDKHQGPKLRTSKETDAKGKDIEGEA